MEYYIPFIINTVFLVFICIRISDISHSQYRISEKIPNQFIAKISMVGLLIVVELGLSGSYLFSTEEPDKDSDVDYFDLSMA